EVTNNMFAQHMSIYYGQTDKRIPFEENTYKNVVDEDFDDYSSLGAFAALAVYWQLEMYHPGYWGKLESLYRERNVQPDGDIGKQKYLVEFSSEALELDLSEHFERHGFKVSEETKKVTGKY